MVVGRNPGKQETMVRQLRRKLDSETHSSRGDFNKSANTLTK